MEAFADLQQRADTQCTSISAIARDLLLSALAGEPDEHVFASRTDWALAVKTRDRYQCVACGTNIGVQAHHIRPVNQHGGHVLSNGKTLCATCHGIVHQTDSHLIVTDEVRTSMPKVWRTRETGALSARPMTPRQFWCEQLALLMTRRRSRRSKFVHEYIEVHFDGIPTEVIIRTLLSLAPTPDVLRAIPPRPHSMPDEVYAAPPFVWR